MVWVFFTVCLSRLDDLSEVDHVLDDLLGIYLCIIELQNYFG